MIGQRNALCSIKSTYVSCRKVEEQLIHPHMADLPRERVEDKVYAFKNTGIDYFSPFEVNVLRRPVKHCCCLFTCLVTRTFHLKVVNGLYTDAGVMAIVIFMARRGKPHTIMSDNGTNLAVAVRDFRECFNKWERDAMCEQLARG